MSDAAVLAAPEDEARWQRLHPATLALAVVALGPKSLNALPAVAALGFTGNWIWIVPAIGAFLLISLLAAWFQWLRFRRSEEHTSELQSLMRHSYAVYCLKKNT